MNSGKLVLSFVPGLLFPNVSGAAPENLRPNIILILADDLGYSDLGCYGGEIKTPNIDRLAYQGIRMTQMYNSARSCPTRASLITGLHPHQAGLGHMTGGAKRGLPGYDGFRTDNNVTIPEVLKTAGYSTYMSGKWHIAPGLPTERGFDEFYGLVGGFTTFWDPSKYTRLPAGRSTRDYKEGDFYVTRVITDYALDFMSEAVGEKNPFFLYLAYNAPHFPLHAPKEDIDRYFDYYKRGWDVLREERYNRMKEMGILEGNYELSPRGEVPKSAMLDSTYPIPAWNTLTRESQLDLARRMAVFAAMVDIMDQEIGRVIKFLEENGIIENTLVMFLSDNGACAEWTENGFDGVSGLKFKLHTGDDLNAMGQPGSYMHYGTGWANAGCTPWTLYKHYTHEGGISTPFIIHWPAKIRKGGKIDSRPMHITDIMATFAEAAGAEYPSTFNGHSVLPAEGESIMPAIRGKKSRERLICIEHEGNYMARKGDWKMVVAGYRGTPELYNISKDRSEQHNLAADYPDILSDLMADYKEWAERCYVLPWEKVGFPGSKQIRK